MRGKKAQRTLSLLLVACLALLVLTGPTFCFTATQTARNGFNGVILEATLVLYERDPAGNPTTIPIEGAEFYLYRKDVGPGGTEVLVQINGRFVTDVNGEITAKVPPGDYCFVETHPVTSIYTYDREPPIVGGQFNHDGEEVRRYDFDGLNAGTSPMRKVAYNYRLTGNLKIKKTVLSVDLNNDEIPMTKAELDALEFTFKVEIGDADGEDKGEIYDYRINGGPVQKLTNGGTLKLISGDTAVFEGLPSTTAYIVREINLPSPGGDYWVVTSKNHSGNVPEGEDGITAEFTNTLHKGEPPTKPTQLTVKKVVAGEIPAGDTGNTYEILLTINGVRQVAPLLGHNGVAGPFTVPAGSFYEVWEKNYANNGYLTGIASGFGTANGEDIEVVVTNTFAATVMTVISGEKTWDNSSDTSVRPPAKIWVELLDGSKVVETADVTADKDKNDRWLYSFTVPKYNNGSEIAYKIRERTVAGWISVVNGYDIVNVLPIIVDPPVKKKITGDTPTAQETFRFEMTAQDASAPMPNNATGGSKIVSIRGEGTTDFGNMLYTKAGDYVYTVKELNDGKNGYTYDTDVYTLTVTVTDNNGVLRATHAWTMGGSPCGEPVFTNRYTRPTGGTSGFPLILPIVLPIPMIIPIVLPVMTSLFPLKPCIPTREKVTVCGQKTWVHGDNDPANYPKEIVIRVLANGEKVVEKSITARDHWSWAFSLNKYDAKGNEICYTVDEKDIPGYVKQISGWDIVNTWQPAVPIPKTGDSDAVWLLMLPMLMGAAGLVLFRYRREREKIWRRQVSAL